MTKRTDIHCPSNFVVEDYRHEFSFSVAFDYDGDPIDEQGLGEVISLAHEGDSLVDTHGANVKRLRSCYSGTSTLWLRCDVCGATFKHGSCLSHKSGKLLFVGHECADTIRGAVEGAKKIKGMVLQAAKKSKRSKANAVARANAKKIMDSVPGLEKALETDHYIVRDIAFRLERWGTISEKQIALVLKIADQKNNPKVDETNWVDVPVSGRTTIVGTVLADKFKDTIYGTQHKMLIKVDTDEGSWKVWGSVPNTLENVWLDEPEFTTKAILKGSKIQFDAKVQISDSDPKFSFFSRPTKAKFIEPVEEKVF